MRIRDWSSDVCSSDLLTDPHLPLEEIVWRLFHEEEEVRVLTPTALGRGCRCNIDHIRDVISRFPADQRAEMADELGAISVDCRSEEHTSELQSLMRISYAVFCLKKKKKKIK